MKLGRHDATADLGGSSTMSSDHTVTVSTVMATKLVTVTPDISIYDVVDLLVDRGISGVPVVDRAGNLIGVLSEKDCLGVLTREAQEGLPVDITVGDLMSRDPVTIRDDTAVARAAEIFSTKPFRRLPVLDKHGQLVGQISRRDVLRAIQLMRKQGARFRSGKSDRTQAGSMITERAAPRVVGPETNKQFR